MLTALFNLYERHLLNKEIKFYCTSQILGIYLQCVFQSIHDCF